MPLPAFYCDGDHKIRFFLASLSAGSYFWKNFSEYQMQFRHFYLFNSPLLGLFFCPNQ